MEIDYKKLVSPYMTTAINNLAEWIKIPSVLDNSSVKKGAPFGPEVQKALLSLSIKRETMVLCCILRCYARNFIEC